MYTQSVGMWCLLIIIAISCEAITDEQYKLITDAISDLRTDFKKLEAKNEFYKSTVASLALQVRQQQFHVEETTRTYGDSGLKLTRLTRTGSKPYFSTTYSDDKVGAIHTHSNYQNLLGMGELVAVLNGVEFRTRHNDYKLRMPSTTSTRYGATQDIPYPKVPPAVLEKETLKEQIIELREWFKAWKNSDHSVRDYRKYFKANLCYLEGMWTNASPDKIDEPFQSDRHRIDAKSFFDLLEKIRFTAATGTKSMNENYAYLPTTISEVDKHGNIVYSQWNYKILCHPIKRDVPLTRFRQEEDLAARVASGKSVQKAFSDRFTRFALYEYPGEGVSFSRKDRFVPMANGRYLDKLMSEIPGKDNYAANITGEKYNGNYPMAIGANVRETTPLNMGFYNNAYKLPHKDAMGASIFRRGFSDNNLYVAYNTQDKVTPVKKRGRCTLGKGCTTVERRVSYAIPLEIVYTTPLQTWNPYNLTHFTDPKKVQHTNKVRGRVRNGGHTPESAYYGTSPQHYYITPPEFFMTDKNLRAVSTADTGSVYGRGFLDPQGKVRQVVSSGIEIMLDEIPGVGKMRVRYPIVPIHDHGNSIYKDLSALTDMTLKKHKYLNLYPDLKQKDNETVEEVYMYETNAARGHVHTVELTTSQINQLISGKYLRVTTSVGDGHSHDLVLWYWEKYRIINIKKCDEKINTCFDGHTGRLFCHDCKGGYPSL